MGSSLGIASVNEHRSFVVTGDAAGSHHADNNLLHRVLAMVARNESGSSGYTALTPDDAGAGVSFGLIQFNQGHGALGNLFKRFAAADHAELVRLTYGDNPHNDDPKALLNQLIEELNTDDQRLTGELASKLTSPRWKRRFLAIGQQPGFQAVQDAMAAHEYLRPAQRTATRFGLSSERALALLCDMSVQHGPTGARRIIARAFEKNPTNVAQMREASDIHTRAVEEHDVLGLIAQESQNYIQERYLKSLIQRREAVLRSPTFSDSPRSFPVTTIAALDEPTHPGVSLRSQKA